MDSTPTQLACSQASNTRGRSCAPFNARSVAGLAAASTVVASALLAGCKPAEPTQTVDFYKAHPDERRAKLKACGNNPGEEGETPNCINASQAEALSVIGTSK